MLITFNDSYIINTNQVTDINIKANIVYLSNGREYTLNIDQIKYLTAKMAYREGFEICKS